jgi:NitT/TauT family transport system substrate-binding protein
VTIRISENFRAVFYAPFYLAQVTGAYREEGADVVLLDSPDPASTAAALRAGEIDVMWGGPLRVLLTHAKDPASDLVCFCDVVQRDPFFIIGREPNPGFCFADLGRVRFASVAEVPTPWICLADDIRRAGIDPDTVPRVTGRSMAENAAALAEARLDAVQLFQPHAEELIAAGKGHLWYAAAARGLTAYTTLVTRRAVIDQRRDELVRIVRAMGSILHRMRGMPATEIANHLSGVFADIPCAMLAASIERYRALSLYATAPVMPRDGFDRLYGAMRAGGIFSRDVAFEDCVDNSLAAEVVAGNG